MQDITDLVSDLDYECQDNRNFHNTMRNKFDKIDSNSAEIGELKELTENLRLQVENLKTTRESSFIQNSLDKIYPVGSVYISLEERNPSTFLGGNWSQISGRFLLACDSTHKVGTLGGEEFHKLTSAEMPAHNHSATTGAAGNHAHVGKTGASGNHTHTRGTMEISGAFEQWKFFGASGAFYGPNGGWGGANTSDGGGDPTFRTEFRASRSWTGETSRTPDHTHAVTVNNAGKHQHSVTVGNTGSGQAHNNMPPYIAVYMYRRIS